MYLFFYVSVFLLIIALHTEERHSHQSLFLLLFAILPGIIRMGVNSGNPTMLFA